MAPRPLIADSYVEEEGVNGSTAVRLSIRVSRSGNAYIGDYSLFDGGWREFWTALDEAVAGHSAQLVVTPNVDQVLMLERDAGYRDAFASARIRLVDGAPLVTLARVLGATRVRRLTGADLLPLAVAHASGYRVVITGSEASTLALAIQRLRADNPEADVHGIPFPQIESVSDERSRDVIKAISDIGPDLVFVCLGAPKQEKWIFTWRKELPPAVYLAVGAAVDIAAGRIPRAPSWMQRAGLEWSWRLLHEPRRLTGRYLIRGPRFLAVMLRSLRIRRGQ